MATFILTWNGSEAGYASREYRSHQIRTQRGERIVDRWSFGTRTGGVAQGDRVFLLRQRSDRGIVASGRIHGDRGIFRDSHWDPKKSDETTNYGYVEWDTVLSLEERLRVEDLLAAIPTHHWNYIQASGQQVQSPDDARLEELWRHHLDETGYTDRPDGGVSVDVVAVDSATSIVGVADAVPLEVVRSNMYTYRISPSLERDAIRREIQLVERFREHLLALGRECIRYKITVPGEGILFTDIADQTAMVLYEAKGVTSRESIRAALGQLLDYRRHVVPRHAVAVLLPDIPSVDLLNLLQSEGIGCVFEHDHGNFRDAFDEDSRA